MAASLAFTVTFPSTFLCPRFLPTGPFTTVQVIHTSINATTRPLLRKAAEALWCLNHTSRNLAHLIYWRVLAACLQTRLQPFHFSQLHQPCSDTNCRHLVRAATAPPARLSVWSLCNSHKPAMTEAINQTTQPPSLNPLLAVYVLCRGVFAQHEQDLGLIPQHHKENLRKSHR